MIEKWGRYGLFVGGLVLLASVASGATQRREKQEPRGRRIGANVSYGVEQARRGKAVFVNSCASCHAIDSPSPPARVGDRIPLVGSEFLAKWRTVGDLFSKVRSTMPADHLGQLRDNSLLDAVAYILQVNGKPGGKRDLTADPVPLHEMLLDDRQAGKPVATDVSTGAFYTEEQARRGKAYFLGNCATCHSTASAPSDLDLAMGRRGSLLAGYRYMPIATGPGRWQRYPNVFSLFNKIRASMPAQDPGGLSLETYVDITAYILKINGASAGRDELSYSGNGMKSMMLNEPGFEKIFNGKNFEGINFVIGVNCRQKEEGCLQNQPGRPFKVEDGAIVCSGAPQGYWYFDKKYLNFTLRFDYRYVRPKELEDDRDFIGASGYFLFVTENQVWPRMLQMEGGFGGTLAPAPLGGNAKFTQDAEARRRVARPLNEWNSVEIVSRNGQVMGYLNGVLVATVTEHDFKEPGYIGFQSEAGEIHWRNIRIKPE